MRVILDTTLALATFLPFVLLLLLSIVAVPLHAIPPSSLVHLLLLLL